MALLDNIGNLANLANAGGSGSLESIGNLLGAVTGNTSQAGKASQTAGNTSAGSDGNAGLNLSDLQSLAGLLGGGLNAETLRNNPQVVQLLAKAVGSAKTPDDSALKTMGDAVKTIASAAPPAEVESELKDIAAEADKTQAGFWTKLQTYLSNADKLAKFIPLASKYAPKAVEALKGMAGNLLK